MTTLTVSSVCSQVKAGVMGIAQTSGAQTRSAAGLLEALEGLIKFKIDWVRKEAENTYRRVSVYE